MSAFVPPPPPHAVAVPPPPLAAIPTPPVAVPTTAVKPGGVALDMSDVFGSPKSSSKKLLPPWERRKSPTSQPSSAQPPAPTSENAPAANQQSVATAPSPSSQTSVAVPTGSPSGNTPASPAAAVPVATVGGGGGVLVAANTSPSAPAFPPVGIPPGPAVVAAPPPAPQPVVASPTPPVISSSTAAPPPVLPCTANTGQVVPPKATAAVSTAAPAAAPQSPEPTASPALVAATARIVQNALKEVHPHLPPPTRIVITPHLVFQNELQTVVAPPLGKLPPGKKKKGTAAPATSVAAAKTTWYNRYDLQPSPSADATLHYRCHQSSTSTETGVPHRQWTSNAVINTAKPKSEWRKPYWQHVDVRRYVARRYFGAPPPVEQ